MKSLKNDNNDKPTLILAIDTSCDDTSIAVLQKDCIIASVVSSQTNIHQNWGGVVPILAKRAHQEIIPSCLTAALKKTHRKSWEGINAIAVTYGPGLAPSLEVGIQKAKELAIEYKLPIIPVNHMEGHLLSPFLKNSKGKYFSKISTLELPWLALTVSGGHTEIVWVEKIGNYKILGRTLDDAAGEAFDKVARMLGLGYPGGAIIEAMSKTGNPKKYELPRPMHNSPNYDFSFSGLKTACLYSTNDLKKTLQEKFPQIVPDYCASLQEAIVDTLLIKIKRCVKNLNPRTILVGGGVSANLRLRKKFRSTFKSIGIPVYFPHRKFCMDNGAMIGLVAYHKYLRGEMTYEYDKIDRIPYLTIDASETWNTQVIEEKSK